MVPPGPSPLGPWVRPVLPHNRAYMSVGSSWISGKTALGTTVTAGASPLGGLSVRLIWDDPETQKFVFAKIVSKDSNTVSLPKIQYCVFAKSLSLALRCLWDCLKRVFWTVFGTPKALPWDGPKIQPILFGRVKRFSECLWESPKMLESISIPIIVRGSPKTQLTLSWNRHWT